MGAITLFGKGSRSRVRDRKRYGENLDKVDMTKRLPTTHVVEVRRKNGRTTTVYR